MVSVQMATSMALDYEKSAIKEGMREKQKNAPQIYDPFLATQRVFGSALLWSVIHHNIKRKRTKFMLRKEICISQHYSN